MNPTYEYLNECFDYNSETGILVWKVRPESHFKDKRASKIWNTRYSKKIAGNLNENGYIYLTVDYKHCNAHRICYCLYYGYFPENEIDHKDRIRHHNWISNLREASRQCQVINSSRRSDNQSGVN